MLTLGLSDRTLAAKTALPQPPKTSTNVPSSPAARRVVMDGGMVSPVEERNGTLWL